MLRSVRTIHPLAKYVTLACQRSFHVSTPVFNSPWYLDPKESPSITSPLKSVTIPKLPERHPQALENLVTYLATELGIDDLSVFDMRNKSTTTQGAYDIADFMVIGSGKSAKHLQSASTELDFYIKHELHKLPTTEGILKSGALAKYHRKLLKKGKKAPNYSKNTYGVTPNTWVMTDTKTDGIVIHMLTKERRVDLNLECLWAKDSEKEKYSSTSKNHDSDDIFKGIRYFHSTSQLKSNSFDPYNVTFDNYADQFRSLLRKHLVDYKVTSLKDLKDHLDSMYSAGITMNYSLIVEYFNTILKSEEFHQPFNTNMKAYIHRELFLFNLLDSYSVLLTNEQILDLLSLIIVSGSGFNNESFLTLKSIIKTFNIQQKELHDHSKILGKVQLLSEKLTDNYNSTHRELKRRIDSLLLTAYANKQNWFSFFKVLDSAIQRNDIPLVQASLPLVAVCSDNLTAYQYETKYLPLLKEAGMPKEIARFADIIYDKTHE